MDGHDSRGLDGMDAQAMSSALKRTDAAKALTAPVFGAPAMHIPMIDPAMPEGQGLFDPAHGKDSCGVGFIADMHNRKTHAIVQQGLQILLNLDHRGAVGADPKLGDGCGILVQIPHDFFVQECASLGMTLPAAQP